MCRYFFEVDILVEDLTMKSNIYSITFRLLNFVAAIFFTLAAYVQYNDPDPELWIPVYLIPAFISTMIGIFPSISDSKLLRNLEFVYVFFATLLSAYVLHHNYNDEENFVHWVVHDEAGREFGGVVTIILWIIFMHDRSNLSVKIWFSMIIIFLPIGLWVYIYLNKEYRKLWPTHCQTALYPDRSEATI